MSIAKTAPASDNLLQKLQTELITGNATGAHVTLVTFKGSGIKTHLRYILETKRANTLSANKVYIWLNFKTYEAGKNKIFQAAIEQLEVYNKEELEPDTLAIIADLLEQKTVTKSEFIGFIKFLIIDKNKTITVLVEGIDVIIKKEPTGRDILMDVAKCSQDISYIFIQDFELEEKHKERLGNIWSYLNSKKVCGKDYLLEKEYAWARLKELYKNLSPQSLNTILEFCEYDNTIFRKVSLTLTELVEKGLDKAVKVEMAHKLIGEEWLTERFARITRNLSEDNLRILVENRLTKADGYLIDSGLVQQHEGGPTIYNRLFGYFLTTNSAAEYQDTAASFNGQELLLFNLLERNFAEIVSKEEIAKEIWGTDWESKYSEWALDKLISNTRSKVKLMGGKTIQSVKKRGVMLTDV